MDYIAMIENTGIPIIYLRVGHQSRAYLWKPYDDHVRLMTKVI